MRTTRLAIRALALLSACLALAGCKPDEVDLRLDAKQIAGVIAGGKETAAFEARFSTVGEMKDDEKADVDRIRAAVEQYLTVDDFRLEKGDYKTDVIIEGEVPIVYAPAGDVAAAPSAWVVAVSGSDLPSLASAYPYKVQLRTTDAFERLKEAASGVNFMLAPDPYGPTRIRLKTGGGPLKVLFGGGQSDSTAQLVTEASVDRAITMTFSGGVYDDIGAGFYMSAPSN